MYLSCRESQSNSSLGFKLWGLSLRPSFKSFQPWPACSMLSRLFPYLVPSARWLTCNCGQSADMLVEALLSWAVMLILKGQVLDQVTETEESLRQKLIQSKEALQSSTFNAAIPDPSQVLSSQCKASVFFSTSFGSFPHNNPAENWENETPKVAMSLY